MESAHLAILLHSIPPPSYQVSSWEHQHWIRELVIDKAVILNALFDANLTGLHSLSIIYPTPSPNNIRRLETPRSGELEVLIPEAAFIYPEYRVEHAGYNTSVGLTRTIWRLVLANRTNLRRLVFQAETVLSPLMFFRLLIPGSTGRRKSCHLAQTSEAFLRDVLSNMAWIRHLDIRMAESAVDDFLICKPLEVIAEPGVVRLFDQGQRFRSAGALVGHSSSQSPVFVVSYRTGHGVAVSNCVGGVSRIGGPRVAWMLCW